SLLIFFWIRALPGSPAEALLGERATPALVQAYRQKYGLNKPIVQQYFTYLKTTAVDRDLGVSVASHREVWSEIRQKFPATIELAVAAMIFAAVLGIPLGFFAAKHYGRVFDQLTLVGSLLGISIPVFFLAIILKYLFAVKWHVLPSVGRIDVTANVK